MAFVHINVPENTPIQSITRMCTCTLDGNAHMEKAATKRERSTSLGNSWHKDLNWLAALTELVYKLELLPVALYNADKATTCALPVGDVPHEKHALA